MFGAILGGLGLASSAWQAKQQSDEASFNRSWQEKLSNNAHQREVADLRAAGLNPILSAGGSGAAVPGGNMPQVPSLAEGLSRGVGSGVAVNRMKADVRHTNAKADSAELDATLDKEATKTLNSNPWLKKMGGYLRLAERSHAASWIKSAGTGIMNSAKAVLGFKKPVANRVINKTRNVRNNNHIINQKLDGYIDTDTGEMIPGIDQLFK